MRIVFFGTARFAVPALEAVKDHVVMVVSQPDRPTGRGMRLQPSAVKEKALELGLAVVTPERSRAPEFVEDLTSLNPDVLLVAAYGQILSEKVLNSAQRGGINLHGSILPKYRGAAPIQRAILNGDDVTGISLMQMDKGMDTGDVISIERLSIDPDDTYGDVESSLGVLGAHMAKEWMPKIAAGDYPRTPQDHAQATHAPKVEKAEAELRVTRSAHEEYNRYRAFTPSPGAFLRSRWGILKISQAGLRPETGEPGTILSSKTSLVIAFAGGSLELLELQPEGKKRMSGQAFVNGMRVTPGMSLNHE